MTAIPNNTMRAAMICASVADFLVTLEELFDEQETLQSAYDTLLDAYQNGVASNAVTQSILENLLKVLKKRIEEL